MLLPVLVVGRATAPRVLKHGVGYTDDGVAYDLLGRSAPFAPAGIAGECAWFTVYVTTTHYDQTVVLRVTSRVDGVEVDQTDLVLNAGAPASRGEQQVHEIDLSQAYIDAGITRSRYAPRGVWLDVTVESVRRVGLGVGARQIVDGIEVEYEVVQEGKVALP
jgi:hypothetical protein